MKFTVALLFTIISSPSALAEETNALGAQIKSFVRPDVKLMIVGDDHQNPSLHEGIASLAGALQRLRGASCVFVELPVDTQPALEQAVMNRDITPYLRILMNTRVGPKAEAWRAAGKTDKEINKHSDSLLKITAADWPEFPAGPAILNLAYSNTVKLAAYDADSSSASVKASLISIETEALGHSLSESELRKRRDSVTDRNVEMAKNVAAFYRKNSCESGILIVGSGHMFSKYTRDKWYPGTKPSNSLSEELTKHGISSAFFITNVAARSSIPTLTEDSGPDKRLYDNYIGRFKFP